MQELADFQKPDCEKDPHRRAPASASSPRASAPRRCNHVRCSFTFRTLVLGPVPEAPAEERSGSPARPTAGSRPSWRRSSSVWSGKHTFHCQRDWWEDEHVKTDIARGRGQEGPALRVHGEEDPAEGVRETSSVKSPIFGGLFGGGRPLSTERHQAGEQARRSAAGPVSRGGAHARPRRRVRRRRARTRHSDIIKGEGDGQVVQGRTAGSCRAASTSAGARRDVPRGPGGDDRDGLGQHAKKAPRPVPAGATLPPRRRATSRSPPRAGRATRRL